MWAGRWRWCEDGDLITLDIPNRRLDLLVPEEEMAGASRWTRPVAQANRGYLALYRERVTQAHQGCDFDFLEPGVSAAEPDIF